jgi:hypothetical protein
MSIALIVTGGGPGLQNKNHLANEEKVCATATSRRTFVRVRCQYPAPPVFYLVSNNGHREYLRRAVFPVALS